MKEEVAPVWNALSILDERDGQYLVEWEGINSATGERWEPSWEPIGNGNTALVAAWKESQPYKIKRETLEVKREAKREMKEEETAALERTRRREGGAEPEDGDAQHEHRQKIRKVAIKAEPARLAPAPAPVAQAAAPPRIALRPPVPTPRIAQLVPPPAPLNAGLSDTKRIRDEASKHRANFIGRTHLEIPRWSAVQLEAFKTRIKREPHLLEAVDIIEATFALSEELPTGDSIGTEDFFNLVSYCPHLKRLKILKLSERCFLSDKGFFPDLRRILAALVVFESTDSRMSRPGGLDHLLPHLRNVHTLSFDPLDFGTKINYPKLHLLRNLILSSKDYHQRVHDKGPPSTPLHNLLVLLTDSKLDSLRLSYDILYSLYGLPDHPVTLPPQLNVIIDTHHHYAQLFQQKLPRTSLSQLHFHFVSEPGISNHSYSSTSPKDFFRGLPDTLTNLSWTITEAAWTDGTYASGLSHLVHMRTLERKPIPNLKRVALFIQKKLATPRREAMVAPMLNEWTEKLKGDGIMLETWFEESTLP